MEKNGVFSSTAVRPIFMNRNFLGEKRDIRELYAVPKQRQCEKLVEFCETTSCHGLGHTVNPKEFSVLKIVWAVIVASFLAIATYLVYLSVANLTNRTLSSEILTNFKNYDGKAVILPDIHICDASIFNATVLEAMGFNGTMATYLTLATSDNAPNAVLINNTEARGALRAEFSRILANGSWTMNEVIKSAAIQCKDMLLGCSKFGQWYLREKCCEKFFNPNPFVNIFGSCITTHGKNNMQTYESRDAGFVVYALPNSRHIIGIGLPINFNNAMIKGEYILQQGLYYAVSSPSVHIESVLHTSGRFALPNAWVSVPITKSMVDNSELKSNYLAPYNCVDSNDPEIRKAKTPEYDYYSETNCMNSIAQKNFRSIFNCSVVFLHHGNSTNFCDPNVTIGLDWDSTVGVDIPLERPSSICPIECVTETYDIAPSYAQINIGLLINKYGLRELANSSQNLVVLHFFYSSFAYQVRISHTNTIIKWLGEVGGNMGLFLGASLITIAEVIALCFRCCFRYNS